MLQNESTIGSIDPEG